MDVKWILRIESAAVGILGVVGYLSLGGPPLLAHPALARPRPVRPRLPGRPAPGRDHLQPRPQLGAGLVVRAIAIFGHAAVARAVAAILIAHVGFDRALGYGLKLPTSFRDTHLGRIGRD